MYADKIKAYFDDLKGREITVVGIGVSHLPLIKLLAMRGAVVTACDKRESIDEAAELLALGVRLVLGEQYLDDLSGEIIFKTPGMRFDHPSLTAAVEKGSVLTSEMEVFFELCPCKIIAVTGSDGKTTTTTLISEMLKAQGYTVHLGGNIGKPLLPEIEQIKPDDIAVVELSSFQLHTMKKSPDIAVVTNLSPNHLDMHKDMEEYVDAKRNILRYQTEADLLVLNLDNEITRSFAEEAKAGIRWFSARTVPEYGIWYTEQKVVENIDGDTRVLMEREQIRLPGDHNVENYMAAIAAVRSLVSDQAIISVAGNFGGVKHRIEFVREVGGVRFYNDSIASSPTRMLASVRAFGKKVILLAGGYDKKIPFDEMGEVLPQYVKALYLSGHTAEKIKAAVESGSHYNAEELPICISENYAEAVKLAYQNAAPGDAVILSPACASFDAFKNFEVRGEYFINCVKELSEKCKE
ncbi:MAG: UDP-N-acetylmuramoyl-L-alanine--D-glutamate ligase [Clostridia bacterium]|nr:UDP-N-acetylmuramoyl-L-alanine--D-glutamate ligase [Clostridia bacterium]